MRCSQAVGMVVILVWVLGTLALGEVPVIQEYGLCRTPDYPCRERTNVFQGTDEGVYVWVRLGTMSEGHAIRWEWYSPDGKLFQTTTGEVPDPGYGYYWSRYLVQSSLSIRGSAVTGMPGRWKVVLLVDGQKLVTMEFEILPTFGATALPPSGEWPKDDLSSGYWAYTRGKPLVDLLVQQVGADPRLSWVRVNGVLVDTGAEYSLFPHSVADKLGLVLRNGERISLIDLSGDRITAWVHLVQVALITPEGKTLKPVTIHVAFAETELGQATLGRTDVLDLLTIILGNHGFEISFKE